MCKLVRLDPMLLIRFTSKQQHYSISSNSTAGHGGGRGLPYQYNTDGGVGLGDNKNFMSRYIS